MALFDRDSWAKAFPDFFQNGQPSIKSFGSFDEQSRNRFLMSIIGTMGVAYKGLGHFLPNATQADGNLQEQVRTQVLPAWRYALNDCSVAQLITGLFLVIGGKTEYIEFPPTTAIKFRAVCMAHRPAYHDVPATPAPPSAPKLTWDAETAKMKSRAIQKAAMIRMVAIIKEANLQHARDKRGNS